MPQLQPIRAIRYAISNGDVSTKIAPPYDVLDEGPKRDLLARDTHNIVAVDLPVTPPKTVGPDSAYEAAGAMFRDWVKRGVLVRDSSPAIFAYEQVFTAGGKPLARRGLFAALGVEEFNRSGGGIFRHENTIKGGTDDRLKLMRATKAQLSPIFATYDDRGGKVASVLAHHFAREPDVAGVTTSDSVQHRLWVITDPSEITAIAQAMEKTDVFIADGHHRYTTAMNYHREHPGNPAAASCLFVLVPLDDPGMIVLPTHRVLCGMQGFTFEQFSHVIAADGRFEIAATSHGVTLTKLADSLPHAGHHAIGLYDPATTKSYTLAAKTDDPLAPELPTQPAVWRKLDVAVFHELLVDRVVRPKFGGAAITYKYPHKLDELVRLCHEEPGRLGVVMQATPLQSVCDVSYAHGVMPPKSTFFYPKLATGLVINPLD